MNNSIEIANKILTNILTALYEPFGFTLLLSFLAMFFVAFVTSLILFRTLLNRNLWMNPLSNIMGGWSSWETVNGEQSLTTECIEYSCVVRFFRKYPFYILHNYFYVVRYRQIYLLEGAYADGNKIGVTRILSNRIRNSKYLSDG